MCAKALAIRSARSLSPISILKCLPDVLVTGSLDRKSAKKTWGEAVTSLPGSNSITLMDLISSFPRLNSRLNSPPKVAFFVHSSEQPDIRKVV
jgi:hypothetical protein